MSIDKNILYLYFENKATDTQKEQIKLWAESSEDNMLDLLRERRVFDTAVVVGKRRSKLSSICRDYSSILLRIACGLLILITATLALNSQAWRFGDGTTTISVPPGQRSRVTLPDGSTVWLNAGSNMTYSSMFEKKREVFIDGMAYFDVAHNEKRPFVVHTYLMDVQVLGTSFDIHADKTKNVFETSLLSGKIHLSFPSGQGETADLLPGHKISLIDGSLHISKIDDYDVYKWKEGLYCFKNKHFSEIISDLERYYDKRIDYTPDPRLERIPLTGKFRISDGLDFALQVLQEGLDFRYSREKQSDNTTIIITTTTNH